MMKAISVAILSTIAGAAAQCVPGKQVIIESSSRCFYGGLGVEGRIGEIVRYEDALKMMETYHTESGDQVRVAWRHIANKGLKDGQCYILLKKSHGVRDLVKKTEGHFSEVYQVPWGASPDNYDATRPEEELHRNNHAILTPPMLI